MNKPRFSRRLMVLLLPVAFLGHADAFAGPTTFMSDDFNSFNLKKIWFLVNQLNDCTLNPQGVNTGNARLFLGLPGGVEHDITSLGVNVAQFHQYCVNEDFTLETKFESGVTGVAYTSYQKEGIIIWANNNDFIHFDFTSGNQDSVVAYAETFIGGLSQRTVKIQKNICRYGAYPLYMRINRSGNTWTMLTSLDGNTFQTAGTFAQVLSVYRIGLFAGNAGISPQPFTMIADYFQNIHSPIVPEDGQTNVTDTEAPLIYGVHLKSTANAVEVDWKTDEGASGTVDYGPTTALGFTASQSGYLDDQHLTTSELATNTLYYFRITATDGTGHSTSSPIYSTSTSGYLTDTVTNSDDFSGSSLDTSIWTIINPRGDASFTVNGGRLYIAVPGGNAHSGNSAPRIMQTAEPTSNICWWVVKFSSIPYGSYTSSPLEGLVFEQDSLNYISLTLTNVGLDSYTLSAASVFGGSDHNDYPIGTVLPYMGGTFWLQVIRNGAHWFVTYSGNGRDWTAGGDFDRILNVERLGVFAGNSGTSPEPVNSYVDLFKAAVPAKPTLLTPNPGASGVSCPVDFAWNAATGAAQYQLQLAINSSFADMVVDTTVNSSSTNVNVSALLPNTLYYWRVRGINGLVNGPFSVAQTFTTAAVAPSAPTLLVPANGSGTTLRTVSLRWTAPLGASSFHLQVATNGAFTSGIVVDDPAVIDTTRTLTNLNYLTTYYWRVNCENAGGTSPWSPTFSFTVSVPLPGQVALVSPADKQVLSSNNVQLVWRQSAPLVDRYQAELAADSLFMYRIVDSTLTDTMKLWSSLTFEQRYFWRVRAHNPAGWGPFSEVRSFTLSASPAVRTLTLASANPASGVVIGVSPADKNGQTNGTTQFARQYNSGTTVTLTAPSTASGNAFQKWLRAGSDYATTTAVNILMDADYTLTAVYVSASTITVTGPLSGASWTVGTQQTVSWTNQNVTGNVSILLSTDGGSNYPITLGSVPASSGSATISVPNNPSVTCRVKIVSANNGAVFGVNPGNFTIAVPQSITVTAPLAGASWTAGTSQQILWTSQNVAGNVTILLSTDGGFTYPTILTTVAASAGSATVTVPNNPSSTCRIGVQSVTNTEVFGLSPGNFSIVEPAAKVIAVTGPPSGASWVVGSLQQVTWTSQNVTGDVNVLLSTDGGASHPATLGSAAVAVGTLSITVPNSLSTTCRVRVESVADVSVYGMNPGNFSIVAPPVPSVTVTNPVAGASWTVGTQQQVTWTSQNVSGDVSILLSTDGGSSFAATLATAQVGAGTATVTVPNAPSSACRVKVESSSNGAVYGLNPGDFNIVPVVRTLTVTSSNPSSGVSINVSPADNNGQTSGATPFARQYNAGSTVTLTAPSQAGGNGFRVWLKEGGDSAITASTNLLMDADYTLTAVYQILPPPPTATGARAVNESSFEATWSGVTGATSYVLDVARDNTFTSYVTGYRARDVGNALQYPVSGLTPGTLYYYQVYAANAGGSGQPSNRVAVRTYVSSYALSATVPFASHAALTDYESPDYQLIGIPGDSKKDIGTILSGAWKQDWQVYWDNGQPANYYVEYKQNTADFSTSAGKAFWVLHKNDLSLVGLASPASLDSSASEATIPLTAGQLWNLITNPFDIPISWQGVIAANGLASGTLLWTYQRQWTNASAMQPYVGYLFANAGGKSALKIPYHLTVPGAVSKIASEVEEEGGWRMDVAVRSGKYEDHTSWFGVKSDASDGKDLYDQHKPRHLDWVADVYFDHPEWDSRYNEFATDVRPVAATDAMQVWEFALRANGRKDPVEVEFGGIAGVPGNLAVYLLDASGGRSQDLRKQTRYSLTPARPKTTFQVMVGREEQVKEKVAAALPHEFALLPNYPNPFNPSTTIPVVVPATGEVSVVVYNMLGQRVRQLVSGSLDSGVHFLRWEGKDERGNQVASGIYYCRMQAGTGVQLTRTLALIR